MQPYRERKRLSCPWTRILPISGKGSSKSAKKNWSDHQSIFLMERKDLYDQDVLPTNWYSFRTEVAAQIEKVYPGSRLLSYMKSDYEPGQHLLHTEGALDKKAGKSEKGGLNEKGRKSYERENPGRILRHLQKSWEPS